MKYGIICEEGILGLKSEKQRVMWRVEIRSDIKMLCAAAEFLNRLCCLRLLCVVFLLSYFI